MATTPWYTSDKLIEAVKRKIIFPTSQATFTEEDILAFANEEMFISQVPAVMQYHEEYFVYRVQTPLVSNVSRYSIPDRAIGMKLRDLFWSDSSDNYFEMTRISEGDKAYFQRNIGANQAIHKFYLENNDVIMTPSVVGDPTGKLNFFIFLRPNQLVRDSRARIFTNFSRDLTLTNTLVPGDKLIVLTNTNTITPSSREFVGVNRSDLTYTISDAVSSDGQTVVTLGENHGIPDDISLSVTISGSTSSLDGSFIVTTLSPNEIVISKETTDVISSGIVLINNSFYIGTSKEDSASNLSTKINAASIGITASVTSSTSTSGLDTVYVKSKDISLDFQFQPSTAVSNLDIDSAMGFLVSESASDLINLDDKIDFLQTKPGHRTFAYDVTVTGILTRNNGNDHVIKVERSDLLTYYSNGYNFQPAIANIQVGDYACLANECIIPQIPPDLHNVLAERTAARILAAMGDTENLQASNAKLQEIEIRQGTLLDNRVEGAPLKITARNSLLRYGRMGPRRRY
jgi:hypothetical protein